MLELREVYTVEDFTWNICLCLQSVCLFLLYRHPLFHLSLVRLYKSELFGRRLPEEHLVHRS